MKKYKLLICILSICLYSGSTAAMGQMPHHDEGHHHDEHHESDAMMGGASSEVGICHGIGNEADWQYHHEYQGQMHNFCSQHCLNTFKSNPQKYVNNIKSFTVESFQFGFEPDTITVKKGDIVRISLKSRDVPHGFNIKDYGINVRIEKGKPKTVEFVADKTGEFDILCSVYCGRGHHSMKAKLIVTE